ncbi:DUF4142 domain-containing protein [Acidicapsa ligni]|uniref:DUF4142 domain-containing protein n=1 Tax=Acidicapsa ligni TaxID=542300 RepID=UPI0021E0469F|nr:DUF4142 domain-containing protein [Acidicapsa ligni]
MKLNMKSRTMQRVLLASCSILMVAATTTGLTQTGLAQAGGQASAADKQFVKEALMGGMAEVQLGQLATQKGSSDDVKQFGQKMIEDHTKLGDQMKEVASQIGVTAPTTVSPKDQATMTRLQGLSGDEFDKAYIRVMVRGHEKDLQAFKTEASSGTSPVVKNAASQGSQVVSAHLDMIKQMAQTHNVTMRAKSEMTEKSSQ